VVVYNYDVLPIIFSQHPFSVIPKHLSEISTISFVCSSKCNKK